MPQMAPIKWLFLFFIFFITLYIFNILNFYCFFTNQYFNKKIKNLSIKNNNYLNWMW